MKKRSYLTYLALAMMIHGVSTSVWAAESKSQDKSKLIARAQSAYRTLKQDMSCLFSRKKHCTLGQKKRIAIAAGVVIGIVALLSTGIYFGVYRPAAKRKAQEAAVREQVEAEQAERVAKLLERERERVVKLYVAISDGNIEKIRQMGVDKAEVEHRFVFNDPSLEPTLLRYALSLGKNDIVRLLGEIAGYDDARIEEMIVRAEAER